LNLATFDPELAAAMAAEAQRQQDHLELIASENYTSVLVMQAQGSVLTNKYAEGYPGQALLRRLRTRRRGRDLAIERAKRCSARPGPTCSRIPARSANGAVYLALLQPATPCWA
jgi:glycine hydroxymethyltransferase